MDAICKLDELRSKTDRELIRLLEKQVEFGLDTAFRGLTADDAAVMKACYAQAEVAYRKAFRLLQTIREITVEERAGLQSTLRRLRKLMDGLAVPGSARGAGQAEISALACAMWQARGCPEGSPAEDWFRAERVLRSRV